MSFHSNTNRDHPLDHVFVNEPAKIGSFETIKGQTTETCLKYKNHPDKTHHLPHPKTNLFAFCHIFWLWLTSFVVISRTFLSFHKTFLSLSKYLQFLPHHFLSNHRLSSFSFSWISLWYESKRNMQD